MPIAHHVGKDLGAPTPTPLRAWRHAHACGAWLWFVSCVAACAEGVDAGDGNATMEYVRSGAPDGGPSAVHDDPRSDPDPDAGHEPPTGCADPQRDGDHDGTPDCDDGCADDAQKTSPGECGCGLADTDRDGDHAADCQDSCPDNPALTEGVSGDACAPLVPCTGSADGPVKVFVLAGQSNMVGMGIVTPGDTEKARNGGMGTLEYMVHAESSAAAFGHLMDPEGAWVERDDVWIVDLTRAGPLTVGYGADTGRFGPELQFGHVIGDFYENPVVLIKIAWGGKSLNVDFRPPSAGGEIGPYYTAMVERVHEVLDNLAQEVPTYRGQGFELAGIVWHQGWNDRIDQTANDAYQLNAVHLINDLRAEFQSPELPFALATTGMGGREETHPRALALMEAQLALATDERIPAGRVAAVETRDYWRTAEVSPRDQGYHWNQNAETYFLIGNGLGDAMVQLLSATCDASEAR